MLFRGHDCFSKHRVIEIIRKWSIPTDKSCVNTKLGWRNQASPRVVKSEPKLGWYHAFCTTTMMMKKNMQIPAVWFERKPVSSGEKSRTATKITKTIRRRSRTSSSTAIFGSGSLMIQRNPVLSRSREQKIFSWPLNCPRLLRHCAKKKVIDVLVALKTSWKRRRSFDLARATPKVHLIEGFNYHYLNLISVQSATVLEPQSRVWTLDFFISRLAK